MSKTALFFSPEGGNVHQVTNKLSEVLGQENVDIIPLASADKSTLENYKQCIFLGSTVGADHWSNEMLEDEWTAFYSRVEGYSMEDTKVAIVGLGNCVLYPEHFADGMADIYKKLLSLKAKVFGFVEGDEYDYTESEAVNEDGIFCGLPIDEDNEDELTVERLENWVTALKNESFFE